MTRAEAPAFSESYYQLRGVSVREYGLTKREIFAMAAMQGLCANPSTFESQSLLIARAAVEQADALIYALNAEAAQ